MAKMSVTIQKGGEDHTVTLENGTLDECIKAARGLGLEVGKVFRSDGTPLDVEDTIEDGETVQVTPKSGAGATA
jgi:hypothetical protein